MSRMLIIALSFLFSVTGFTQDIEYAREVLARLSSKDLKGRGYVKQGDLKAAEYIATKFSEIGLKSFGDDYFQHYDFPINTLPAKVSLKVGDSKLKPGVDYVISNSNSGLKGTFLLHYLHDSIDNEEKLSRYLSSTIIGDAFLVSINDFRKLYGMTIPDVKGFVVLTEKMPNWHVSKSNRVSSTFWIKIQKDKVQHATNLSVNVESEFVFKYPTQNVIGYVEGKDTERFVVYTAHYDHLGMMGSKTYFPGANDNGSGTAMLLDLAKYYANLEEKPVYSIAFMAFSGEEAGLRGSSYYVENPLFMLEAIPLLINLDMVGTGSEGITIVNSMAYGSLYAEMSEINEKNELLSQIKQRGEACNSDHCPFYNIGVKSIFIYTMGPEHLEYHTVADTDENFPFTAYEGLFKLLTTYVSQLE